MTDAEQRLWRRLRQRQMKGYKFRRQVPIGPYIADFACLEARLIIELDGSQHADAAPYDRQRDDWLRAEGLAVLRFWNNEVFEQLDAVAQRIFEVLPAAAHPHPNLPPSRGKELSRR